MLAVLPLITFKNENEQIVIKIEAIYRKDTMSFFIELCTNWLLPGKALFVSKLDFNRREQVVVCEALILAESSDEALTIYENFTLMEGEIKLGLRSAYHAKKLMELKGLVAQEKEVFVKEFLRERIFRFSKYFDYDIFSWMYKFFAAASEEYKEGRAYQVLSRIICNCYLISQKLLDCLESMPDKRHFYLKLMPIKISTPFGKKMILGCTVGMNFLKENEILEDKQVLRAIRKYCPEARIIGGSYFVQKEEKTVVFYLEVEVEDSFAYDQIALMKNELKDLVKNSIENLVLPVFMPRNEEEVMKYVVTLSAEVTHPNDLPQIVIMFNEQTSEDLIFTLLMVRPIIFGGFALQDILVKDNFDFRIEKIRSAGYLKKTVSKEASQTVISLKKISFLRDDFVVDLYKARQAIVLWLGKYLGSLRDYNGGMISRQMDLFLQFQEYFPGIGAQNEHRLSDFFHSLYPIELKTSLPVEFLHQFYLVFCGLLASDKDILDRQEEDKLYICMKEKGVIVEAVRALKLPPFRLLQFQLYVNESTVLGFLLLSESAQERNHFFQTVNNI